MTRVFFHSNNGAECFRDKIVHWYLTGVLTRRPLLVKRSRAHCVGLLSVNWFWRGCWHVSRLFWRNDGCTWRVSHCGCSIGRSEHRRRFVFFVEMPSVTSQLSMLALHKVGTRLDMRACNDCGPPHISSLDAHNITRIQLL